MTTNTFRRPGAVAGSEAPARFKRAHLRRPAGGAALREHARINKGRGPGRTKIGSFNPGEFKSTTRDQRRDATDQLAKPTLRREKTGRERSRREGHPTSCYTVYRRNQGSQ